MTHPTKRRAQVDAFFCNEALTALGECGCLPEEFSERTLEYEKSTKLNPPTEQRVKVITEKELDKARGTVKKDVAFTGGDTSETIADGVNSLPLMNEEKLRFKKKNRATTRPSTIG